MKNTKHQIAMSCISIAMCIVTLFSFSFSWIKRDWSPTVEQEGITITATSALSIILGGNPADVIKLQDVLGVESINLRQVSNATGESNDFFYLESDGRIQNSVIHRVTRDETNSNDNKYSLEHHGYVEFKFMITGKSASDSLDVYLSKTSYLKAPTFTVNAEEAKKTVEAAIAKDGKYEAGDDTITKDDINKNTTSDNYVAWVKAAYNARYNKLLNAIRISITTSAIKDDGAEDTSVYKTIGLIGGTGATHTGLNPDVVKNGDKLYIDGNPNAAFIANYGKFQNFETFVQGAETPILTMKSSSIHYITIRVWLEGTDDNCTEDIAGLKFDLLLQFDSKPTESTETESTETTSAETTAPAVENNA